MPMTLPELSWINSSKCRLSMNLTPLPRAWLPGVQAHLPLGAGHPGDRVEHEQHAPSLLAKVLGDGRGDEGRLEAHQAGRIAGGADDDRTGAPGLAQRLLEKVHHLAAALADQRDHVD